LTSAPHDPPPRSRPQLRQHLLRLRDRFAEGPAAATAQAELTRQLHTVVDELDPQRLGLYWPVRSEFNAPVAFTGAAARELWALALPFARRRPVEMHYRCWDGQPPTLVDECGIPSCTGDAVVPDVVLVPCLGFTSTHFRLGYGGGYFDRWLAAHSHVTAVGVAWSVGAIDAQDFEPQAHDRPMMLVVTETGVF
jgi:5,10-methenyltetrahydrofolate synthetase